MALSSVSNLEYIRSIYSVVGQSKTVRRLNAIPRNFYPDHWRRFGGAVNAGGDPRYSLARELREELEFEPADAREFTRFDFTRLGQWRVYRIYCEVPVSAAAFSRLVLHEGVQVRAFSAAEILSQPRVTPYDAFAIRLHCRRERFRG